MDSDDLKPKANRREVLLILRPILLGIFGGCAHFAYAITMDSLSVAFILACILQAIFDIILAVLVLMVGFLAIMDLRKIRRSKENLAEGPERKFLQVSFCLDVVVLIAMIINFCWYWGSRF